MKVKGQILVEDIVSALELDDLPEGCPFKNGDTIDFYEVDVDNEDAYIELDQAGMLTFDSFADQVDQSDVTNLSAAIRRGDTAEAELLLDRVFRGDTRLTEWVQLGRYSARARRTEPKKALRAA